MTGYADVQDPNELLNRAPDTSGGPTVEDAVKDAGIEVQAVDWVWRKVVGESLVESIIEPITGDFEQIAKQAGEWENVCDALQAVRNNLNAGLQELDPAWTGDAAQSFKSLISTQWTVAIEADAQAAKLIGIALNKVADGSKKACDKCLDLIKKLVDKLIEAAAMLPIPVVGWARAVKLVYDGIELYNAIMSLIEGIKSIIQGAQQVIQGIQQVGAALAKLKDVRSLNDLINVANETGEGVATAKGGLDDIKDGFGDVKDGATSAASAAHNAHTHATEPANPSHGSTDTGGSNDNGDGTTPGGTTKPGDDSPTTPKDDPASSSRPDDPNSTKTPADSRNTCGDPIDVVTGEMLLAQTDVDLAGVLPLVLRRTHVSGYRAGRLHGRTWTSTLDQRLEVDRQGAVFAADDGMLLVYPPVAPGGTVLPAAGPRWPLARTESGYTLTKPESGHVLHFPERPTIDRPLTAIVDRNGNRIDFDRDDTGTPTAVRHSGGYHVDVTTSAGHVTELRLRNAAGPDISLVRFGYDDDDRLTEVVNSSGRPLRFDYDVDGRVTQWTDRNGEWYRYRYDETGRCVANEGSGGFLNGSFVYLERTTRYTDALGNTTIYLYNDRNQVVAETDALGNTTTSEWDEFDHLLSRTDPLGRMTSYRYDADGFRVELTRPDGAVVRTERSAFGAPTRVVDVDDARWLREYDERGNLVAETDPAGATTRYTVDSRGHVVGITDGAGTTTRIETNAAGLPVVAHPPHGGAVRYDRDQFGRIVAVTDQLGGTSRFSWTVEGNPVSRTRPDGATERWRHDSEGNQVEHVDALGQTVRTTLTHFDLPAAEERPDGSRFTFGYDPTLRLTSVTNGQGLVWRYEYDVVGNLVRETDFNGVTIAYTYDAAGQLIRRTEADGRTTTYLRDPLGNVVERQWSTGERATYAFTPRGYLVRAVNDDAELTYERDPLGRVLAETVNGRTVTSTYDALGRRIGRQTPTGARSEWGYGVDHRPTSLQTGGHTVWFRYDVAGHEVQRLLDTGTALSQTWDVNHRLTGQTVTATAPGAAQSRRVQQRTYGYRADDSVTAISDLVSGERRYDLDRAGRVVGVTAANWQERYAYDPSGNIASAQAPGTESPSGAHAHTGTLLQETGSSRYVHDRCGRVVMVQRKRLSRKPDTWRYSWNGDSRLTGVITPDGTRWRYRYDPLGRRIAKQRLGPDDGVVEEMTFAWDGDILVEQISSAGRATTWEWEADGLRPITQVERVASAPQQWVDEKFYSIVTDLVGAPSELVDADGGLAWHASTTLWGRALAQASAAASTPLRFPGQYHDPETGLNYNRHRYYDPEAGNYQSPDPLGLVGGPNPHAYVPNPVRWIDPLGLTPCEEARSRNAALNDAKRDAGIPRSTQPDEVNRVPMTNKGKTVMDENHDPVMTREYTYTRPDGSQVIIQDHGAGHSFDEGGVGDQGPHFNVRPPENTRTGHVPGTQDHYPFGR